MVIVVVVGVMVHRAFRPTRRRRPTEYITALVEQNKRDAARADEMVAKTLEISKSSLECVMAFKSAIESTERGAHQGHVDDALDKLNATVKHPDVRRRAQKAEHRAGPRRISPAARPLGRNHSGLANDSARRNLQTAEGRDYLARVAKSERG